MRHFGEEIQEMECFNKAYCFVEKICFCDFLLIILLGNRQVLCEALMALLSEKGKPLDPMVSLGLHVGWK